MLAIELILRVDSVYFAQAFIPNRLKGGGWQ